MVLNLMELNVYLLMSGDKYSQQTYMANFPSDDHKIDREITKIPSKIFLP